MVDPNYECGKDDGQVDDGGESHGPTVAVLYLRYTCKFKLQ